MSRRKIKNRENKKSLDPERLLAIFLLGVTLFAFALLFFAELVNFYQSFDFYKLSLALTTALMIGVASISFARYAAKPNQTVLFIGLAFISHAFLDIVQLFIISDYGMSVFFINQYSAVYWSWIVSQCLWALLLFIATILSHLRHRYGAKASVRSPVFVIVACALTFAAALFFIFLDLPIPIVPIGPFEQPFDFLPAVAALVTLLTLYSAREWRSNPFDFGLIVGLFCVFLAHILFSVHSVVLFDGYFYISHVMTNIGLIFIVIGMLQSMTRLMQDVELQEGQIEDRMQEIKREKALDDTFIESIGDAIVVTDSDTRITRVNKAFQAITGWKETEAVGQPVTKILPMLDAVGALVPYEKRPQAQALFRGQKVETSMQSSYVRKDMSHFTVSSTVTPVIVEGEIIGAIEVFRDVSKEKLIDEQKSTFVSVASHQLRTPLTSLNWYTEMLLSGDAGKINKKQKEFLQEIYQGSKRLVLLVNDLLNISRIESGRLTIEPEPTDLSALITDVITELKPLLEGRSCKIQTKIPKTGMKEIPLDPLVFHQVLHNLLTNAIRYSPKDKSSTILVAVARRRFGVQRNLASFLKPGNYIVVSVTDEGIGIPKNQQQRIFEKFFRADNALHAAADGSGLGLYFIKMIMEAAGGKLWFKSVEKKGSTFFVAMPVSGMKKHIGEKRISSVAPTTILSKEP